MKHDFLIELTQDSNASLQHHGIKGQKWGVRRYQNTDGSLTDEGRKRYGNISRTHRVDPSLESIINSMSKDDLHLLGYEHGYKGTDDYRDATRLVHSTIIKSGNIPMSFFNIDEYNEVYNVSLGTRGGKENRGKGYATKAAKRGIEWIEKNKNSLDWDKPILWSALEENEGSRRLAEKMGFKESDRFTDPEIGTFVNYEKWLK